jgi:hypothetical protein
VLKSLRKFLRVGVPAASLVFAGGGVAAADPVSLPDVSQRTETIDHYILSAELTDVTINSVPNMAATAFTREAYVSATAKETIDGSGVPVIAGTKLPVTGGKLTLALMVGCQIDLSGGAWLGGVPWTVFGNATAPFTAGSNAGGLGAGIPFFGPTASGTARPGTTNYIKLDEKDIQPEYAAYEIGNSGTYTVGITVHEYPVKVDGCGGPVSVRLVATAQVSSPHHNDEVNMYGDVVSI